MKSKRTYKLRQAILRAFEEYNPAPIGYNEIDEIPGFSVLRPNREELVVELRNLATWKFIEEVPGSNGDYLRITGSGLDQINQETDRDPHIWGVMGL